MKPIPISEMTPALLMQMMGERAPVDLALAQRLGVPDDVIAWLITGERGCSSNAIVQHLTGYPTRERSAPLDPDDLRRCRLLLDACPSLVRPFVERMGALSLWWSRLVEWWDDLCELMDYEIERCPDPQRWRCPETYAAMHAIEESAR